MFASDAAASPCSNTETKLRSNTKCSLETMIRGHGYTKTSLETMTHGRGRGRSHVMSKLSLHCATLKLCYQTFLQKACMCVSIKQKRNEQTQTACDGICVRMTSYPLARLLPKRHTMHDASNFRRLETRICTAVEEYSLHTCWMRVEKCRL